MHLLRKRCRVEELAERQNANMPTPECDTNPSRFAWFMAGINMIESGSDGGNDADMQCCSAMD